MEKAGDRLTEEAVTQWDGKTGSAAEWRRTGPGRERPEQWWMGRGEVVNETPADWTLVLRGWPGTVCPGERSENYSRSKVENLFRNPVDPNWVEPWVTQSLHHRREESKNRKFSATREDTRYRILVRSDSGGTLVFPVLQEERRSNCPSLVAKMWLTLSLNLGLLPVGPLCTCPCPVAEPQDK